MTFSTGWHAIWIVALAHHLWQSSVVCLLLWPLTLMLRRNSARMRFRVWMLASLKFLLPFGLLIGMGERLSTRTVALDVEPYFAVMVEGPAQSSHPRAQVQAAHVVSSTVMPEREVRSRHDWVSWSLAIVWGFGSLVLVSLWSWRWLRLKSLVRRGETLPEVAGVRAVLVPSEVEPGIFGLIRPVLLLPRGISETMVPAQLGAVIEHELSHVRRRDNLIAAVHMLVSALFWFHPFVWWIGAQLMKERETACDEAVLMGKNSSLVYAEGILNVCKFYMEVPMACVSGVTGSDLKRRIAHILSERVAQRLDLTRKVVLGAVGLLSLGIPVAFGVLHASRSYAQAPAKQNIDDTWQGTLHVQKDLRTVLRISKAPDGTFKSLFYSIDQGGQPFPIKETTFQAGELKLNVEAIDGIYIGKMSPDGTTITGEWKQGDSAHPLIFVRATPETAWAIPEPAPKIPPMAADVDPNIEVATVKPSDPNSRGKGFGGPPRHFQTHNTTLNDLIMFAYGVNSKQVVNGQAWMESDKFDIVLQPDAPGAPSEEQVRSMMRKLLASRFGLKFHSEKKELSAYILTVAKGGPKLTKSEGDPHSPHAFFFTKLGSLTVRNATMEDFANGMQGAVFDRPVVNHTGLEGHWDCSLKWTPDETQFQVFGVKIVPNEAADAPPPVFTAIQEQIGLKLDAAKTMVDVMVLDHVEKPSEN